MGFLDDLFGLGDMFDFDGDGETGLFDAFVANEWFDMFNEYCDIKERQRELQSGKRDDFEND
ncbi:MAG: hypothetical protein J5562_07685 [Clostridia bacterium]|nr:hypothetical protein [Clostridia bacterium]